MARMKATIERLANQLCRKPESWGECNTITPTLEQWEDVQALPRIMVPHGVEPYAKGWWQQPGRLTPLLDPGSGATMKTALPQVFVAVLSRNRSEFLINTEGYDYCRYAARLQSPQRNTRGEMVQFLLEAMRGHPDHDLLAPKIERFDDPLAGLIVTNEYGRWAIAVEAQ